MFSENAQTHKQSLGAGTEDIAPYHLRVIQILCSIDLECSFFKIGKFIVPVSTVIHLLCRCCRGETNNY